MRKAFLLINVALISFALMSFNNLEDIHYGGSASASGKVTYVTDYEKTQGRKVGDVEPIQVTVNCRYDNDADAKAALKSEVENQAALKHLKVTTAVSFEVSNCK